MAFYLLISLASFLVASLFQLIVVGWLIFGDPQGPLWVGFFAPLGFVGYLIGTTAATVGFLRIRNRALMAAALLNGSLACAYVGACFAYVLFVAVLKVGAP
jgi:hypothetical protein